jgi:hypothetical protein
MPESDSKKKRADDFKVVDDAFMTVYEGAEKRKKEVTADASKSEQTQE